MTPRIAPGGVGDVGLFTWVFARIAGRVAGTGPPNLFLTFGRRRGLFRGWLRFAGRLMPRGSLPRRETELIILRVARGRDCAYEFEHHVRLGRRAGLTDADIVRVTAGPDAEGWSPRERVLLLATDELLASEDLTDATWEALREHLDERRVIEFLFLVGHYRMLASFITTVRIEPDA
ncbi:MAG: carboxymuconolactone decarboxylase family protein [Solirubrobacteraceae bacterium]